MPTVADVLRRYGGQYSRAVRCHHARGAQEGAARDHCVPHRRTRHRALRLPILREIHAIGRSCGNRHCPTCQHDKTKAWLEKQTDRLLPCPYFLVTFTLPAELRTGPKPSARDLRRAVRGFQRCASPCRNPRFVGTDRLGFFGVLHTGAGHWSTTRTCTTSCRGADRRGWQSLAALPG